MVTPNLAQFRWLPCLLCVLALGCSGQLKTYPVQGKVQFAAGGPVHVGTVELKSREHGVQARGEIEEDGRFTLTTFNDGDGAVAGTHDCVVVQFVITENIEGHRPSTLGVVARHFGNYATSGLTVTIEPQNENEILLEVEGITRNSIEDSDGHKH